MIKIEIDKSKLGIIKYGVKIEKQLQEKYKDRAIKDVIYDYFSEGFYLLLDNDETIYIDI